MTVQYDRQVSIKVSTDSGDAIEFSDFKMTFSINRGDIQTPNSADVRIYNLAPNTVTKIAALEFTTITIKAGYPGNFAQIFSGSIKQCRTGRTDQRDTYVDITAADSDRAYNFAHISLTLDTARRGSIATAIINAIGKFNVTPGPIPPLNANQFIRGQTLYGGVKDEMADFSRANDMHAMIQDGVLTFVPNTSYLIGDAVEVGPETGLVGVPEQTSNGIEVNMLLNPSIKIGSLIKLVSPVNLTRFGLDNASVVANKTISQQIVLDKQGLYYVMMANHSGDTRGPIWYTTLLCLAVDATVVETDITNRLFSSKDAIPRSL